MIGNTGCLSHTSRLDRDIYVENPLDGISGAMKCRNNINRPTSATRPANGSDMIDYVKIFRLSSVIKENDSPKGKRLVLTIHQ